MKSLQGIHSLESTDPTTEEDFDTLAFQSICIGNINDDSHSISKVEVYATVNISVPRRDKDKTTLKAKLDTGAQ